jgi:RNA recognition motif-containing protein
MISEHTNTTTCRIYIGNLNFAMDDEALRNLVARLSGVPSERIGRVEVVRDRLTGRSRGFAFIELLAAEDARRALSDLDGVQVMGRSIRVQLARHRGCLSGTPRISAKDY